MIDGENALFDRPRHIRQLMRLVSKLDVAWQERILENLAAVNDRASRLYPLTEVYVHENRSRYKWLQLQSIPVHSVTATGIAGTDEIGMNYCQQTWIALNRVIDKRDDMERDWTHAKFIGSCFNGQGVRQVDARDKARLDQDRQKIDELKMKILYKYLNRDASPADEMPSTVQLPNGKTATVTKKFQAISAEELAEQLEAALAGEKDYHDLAVEAQERRIRERAEQIDEQKRLMYTAPITEMIGGYRILRNEADAKAYIERMNLLRYENARRAKHPIIPELNEASDKPEGSDPENPR
jgi:hypothetical protein